jgi:hypothetical protein
MGSRKSIKITPNAQTNFSQSGSRDPQRPTGSGQDGVPTTRQPAAASSGASWFVGLLGVIVFFGMISTCGDSTSTDATSYSALSSTPSVPTPHPTLNPAGSTKDFYIHGPLNVRNGAGKDYPTIRSLARGDRVQLGPKDVNGWAPLYTATGSQEGFVYRASDLVRSEPPAAKRSNASTSGSTYKSTARHSSAESRGYYTGPRGGCYTYSASGRKRYVDRSYCN